MEDSGDFTAAYSIRWLTGIECQSVERFVEISCVQFFGSRCWERGRTPVAFCAFHFALQNLGAQLLANRLLFCMIDDVDLRVEGRIDRSVIRRSDLRDVVRSLLKLSQNIVFDNQICPDTVAINLRLFP